ncbi:uncharacterized protein LOC133307553 [Gastrolobium bilobum]|uniref:uncharacterized protein LOC133307553 n=1 Tax=Gastrolobium bilobum TaxID=150636 RepID=UPI002AAF466E|nr:uncharacterized protein LOC133307553 [Gastrolobium bilobum]
MEETLIPKRPREEPQVKLEDVDCEESSKRHKPYNHILSLLESEEDDSTEDLSSLVTTLQQEITCASDSSDTLLSPPQNNGQHNLATNLEDCSTSTTFSITHSNDIIVKEDDKEKVMRHLLEASDDELGIPNREEYGLLDFGENGFNGGDMFSSICDGLWELEDETANYYALLQSEFFL